MPIWPMFDEQKDFNQWKGILICCNFSYLVFRLVLHWVSVLFER